MKTNKLILLGLICLTDVYKRQELGAVNVMTGIYTGRSPKDKFFVMNEADVYKRQVLSCGEYVFAPSVSCIPNSIPPFLEILRISR